MTPSKNPKHVSVMILNGETIIHIPQHVIAEFGDIKDGDRLDVNVKRGQLVIDRKFMPADRD